MSLRYLYLELKRKALRPHYLFVKSPYVRDSYPGGPPRSPVPQQAHPSLPSTGKDAPPLFWGLAVINRGFVSSPVRQTTRSGKSAVGFPEISTVKFQAESPGALTASGLTAFSFPFVAKPNQAAGAACYLPAAVPPGLVDVAGFADSLVMVADREACLITVIIFFGRQRSPAKLLPESVRRSRASGSLPGPLLARAESAGVPQRNSQASSIDTRLITEESITGKQMSAWLSTSC